MALRCVHWRQLCGVRGAEAPQYIGHESHPPTGPQSFACKIPIWRIFLSYNAFHCPLNKKQNIVSGWGFAPDPLRELTTLPRLHSRLRRGKPLPQTHPIRRLWRFDYHAFGAQSGLIFSKWTQYLPQVWPETLGLRAWDGNRGENRHCFYYCFLALCVACAFVYLRICLRKTLRALRICLRIFLRRLRKILRKTYAKALRALRCVACVGWKPGFTVRLTLWGQHLYWSVTEWAITLLFDKQLESDSHPTSRGIIS